MRQKSSVDNESKCWKYNRPSSSNGYCHVGYRGGIEYVHRIAAIIFHGFDPATELVVRHTCDQSACWNPEHLRIGTQRDNMRDAAEKGHLVGKKLNEDQVAIIKRALADGTPRRTLAQKHGVSLTAIAQIDCGMTWKDIKPASPQSTEASPINQTSPQEAA